MSKVVTFRVSYISRQKLLHFALMLHFASIVTFCGVTGGVTMVPNLRGGSPVSKKVQNS